MRFLFKVSKISSGTLRFDDSFKVKRICSDASIMEAFNAVRIRDCFIFSLWKLLCR
jgi:hypothetical protein